MRGAPSRLSPAPQSWAVERRTARTLRNRHGIDAVMFCQRSCPRSSRNGSSLALGWAVCWRISFLVMTCALATLEFPWITDTAADVAAHGGIIRSEFTILYGAVAFIFLVSGLQLSHEKLRQNLTSWRLHVIVQGISFVLI